MRFGWIVAIALAIMTSGLSAQTPNANPSRPAPQSASGEQSGTTDVLAELTKSVNTKKVQPGDVIKATVTQDVLIHGQVVIPRGSKLIGHITEAKVRSQNDKESLLGLIFDKVLLKDGREINFNGTVGALAPPVPMNTDLEPVLNPPTGILRDDVGGPQHAPSPGGSPRGTGLPSTDTPLDTSASATNNAARMNRDLGRPGADKSAAGLMSAGSRGVFGLPGLKLQTESVGGHGSVISSLTRNVVLEGGTQLLVEVSIPVQAQ
jgi:hypothetical protein